MRAADVLQGRLVNVLEVSKRFAGLRIRWRLIAQPIKVIDLFGGTRPIERRATRSHAAFERVRAAVNAASVPASKTCQMCGQPGRSGNSMGWKRTLCGQLESSPGPKRVRRRHELHRLESNAIMTMPDERLRAINWGGELLEQITLDDALPASLISAAKRIAMTYPAPQALDEWLQSGAAGLRPEWTTGRFAR